MVQTKKDELKINHIDINSLKAAEYNPRRLTSKQEEDLTNSIKRFGLVDPIIVNTYKGRENIIIGGTQRWTVAKTLKFKEIPVVFISLPIEKEKELNLRLNRNTGEWDYELLKGFQTDMLLDVGFDENDLQNVWEGLLETEDDNFHTEKEIEKAKETDIKLGDMFLLGRSMLLCGDATDPEVIKKLMGNEKVDMVYCDPPYNQGWDYSNKKNYKGEVDDNKSDEEYREFLKKTIVNGLSVSKKDLHIFYYCNPLRIGLIQELYKELGIINKRVLIWLKNNQNPTPKLGFNRIYEPAVYGTVNNPYLSNIKNFHEIMNKEVDTGNRAIEDILDLIDIWLVKRLPSNEMEHPTEKSPILHERALRRCTKVNDVVLDMFSGSGSTLLACEQLKRRCYTCDVNAIFCQLTINRYEAYANTKAKKLN